MIKIKNITKRYENNFIAVNNVSIEIAKGEMFALLGNFRTGCGQFKQLLHHSKSRHARTMCGRRKESSRGVSWELEEAGA